MKLSEMREMLDARGIHLTKSLGQNFLHDQNQIRRITALGSLSSSDHVLEIGPGLGPLTESLLESGASVLAIEKDARLVSVLEERFRDRPNFQLLHADALVFLRQERRDWSDWKLVSNLPYSVGSPILVELALAQRCPERLVATLQFEVVQRIAARAGDPDYGQLSLFLQVRYEPGELFRIPPGSFFPPPDVDSACILLRRRTDELLAPAMVPVFYKVVKRAFSERRKMMAKLLKSDWATEKVLGALAAASVPLDARAETVTLDQFVQITKLLAHLEI